MQQQIVIAGSGFAGTWAALSAARAIALAGRQADIGVTVVSPQAQMVIRPRLYEALLDDVSPDLLPLFAAVGVTHLAGSLTAIDHVAHQVSVRLADGSQSTLAYDQFVLATGSGLFRPTLPGLAEHSFNVDQLADAQQLQAHLQALASSPDCPARNTVVVAGGGFTGIEVAAEMPARLRAILGDDTAVRVVLIERAAEIGPALGPVPRPVIETALRDCGVETMTSCAITAISPTQVTLADGQQIASQTVIWTAGARAQALVQQLPGRHDQYGRLHTDAYLRAPEAAGVWVTGDVAHVATDTQGNVAAMSCQHALSLGRVAGHNAAATLLGLPLHPYSQPKYVTCLDIGAWGALYTEGWERHVCVTGSAGKQIKKDINTKWIYPPAAERDAVFAVANPDYVIVP